MVRVSGTGAFVAVLLFRAPLFAQSAAPEPAPAPTPAAAPEPAGAAPPPAAYTAPEQQPAPPPPAAAPPPGQPPPPGYPPPAGQPPPPGYPPPPAYGPPYQAPYEPPPPEEAPEDAPRDVSVTISPLHLLLPVIEGQVEARIYPHFSLALIGGYGSVTVPESALTLDVVEIGGQITGYPIKDFKSLQLGVEVLYVRVSGDNLGDSEITGVADGVAVGPFVGYKVLTSGGFTFAVQGGFQYLAIKGEASDNAGNTQTDEASDVIFLLNANIGWSF